MMGFLIVGIGELLWDYLPDGKKLGGAPANFSYHAQALGAESYIISSIGDDQAGLEILSEFKKMNISDKYVSIVKGINTGSVYVSIDHNGVPSYQITDNVAWDHIRLSSEHMQLTQTLDAVCFGTLAQRTSESQKSIERFLSSLNQGVVKIFDVNFRKNFYTKEIVEKSLQLCSVVKMNEEEMHILAEMFNETHNDGRFITRLIKQFDIDLVALTRGGNGSILYCGDEIFEHPGYPVDVCDTIGAGDAFTAALALGILNNKTLEEISDYANKVSSFVCRYQGATPAYNGIIF